MNVQAIARRSGKWWAIEVPQIPGLFTQTKRLDQVAEMVTDAASLLGHEVATVEVVPDLTDKEIARLLADANKKRAELREVETAAAVASRKAVSKLRDAGLPVRDVAMLMGVTPQRVSALAAA